MYVNTYWQYTVLWYFHLDLSRHVMSNVSRFCLRAHILRVEAAMWLQGSSCVSNQHPGGNDHAQDKVHAIFPAKIIVL